MLSRNSWLPGVLGVLICTAATGWTQNIQYPHAAKVDQTDSYFGKSIADPYRWLENDKSPETANWVAEETRLTNTYLENIPYRAQIKERMEKRVNYVRYSKPTIHGKYVLFYKNSGLQNQSELYIQNGPNGKPEVLIDPNTLFADGTTRLTSITFSKNGKYAAYGISHAGSDWQEFHVMAVQARKTLPDTVKWIKFSTAAWHGDGFYYTRYPQPAPGGELTAANSNPKIYYHSIGATQDQDKLFYEEPEHPRREIGVLSTEDERFLFMYVGDSSTGKQGNALYYRDFAHGETKFTPIVETIGDANYGPVDAIGGKILIRTDHNAPNQKICLFDPQHPAEKDWKEVIPEGPEVIQDVETAGGKLFLTYLKNVSSHAYIYSLAGKQECEMPLPALGTTFGTACSKKTRFILYTFSSFAIPPTIYQYDVAERKTSVFLAPRIPGLDPEEYRVEQVFYPSKDGTKIPMFLVYKKGLQRDGTNPTELYGYGGFGMSQYPGFSPGDLVILEQGFVLAIANLRGGGEYGEKWHQDGSRLNKQNSFDDFIAAAEYLISNKYTSPEHLALEGASNGGLLIGAVINQRPDLCKVAIPMVGVMDMLRYQKFTNGAVWAAEYGSSEDETQFKYLYRYSPLHNIHEGAKYPATLVTTADHDDRVVPAHSFKYTATLQAKSALGSTVLIRIDTNSGHSGSNLSKGIQEEADIDAFMFYNLGVKPKYLQ